MWEGRNKRNDNLAKYLSQNDLRLTVLINDLMNYLNDWEQDIETRPGHFSKSQRSGMKLSYQSITGL